MFEAGARGGGALCVLASERESRLHPRDSPGPRSGPVLRPRPPPLPQTKGVNLSCVRTCMVVAEERPRIALTQSFSKLFKDLGLPARAVSTTFGCRVNVAICLQVRGPGCRPCWPRGVRRPAPPSILCAFDV